MADDFFEAAADHFGKAHFIFGGKSLGFAKKRIGNLDLCFYHDGILSSCWGLSICVSATELSGGFFRQDLRVRLLGQAEDGFGNEEEKHGDEEGAPDVAGERGVVGLAGLVE